MTQPTPGRGTTWRPLSTHEAIGSWCAARGLIAGDCAETRTAGSRYCYYHDKVQKGLVSAIMDERSELLSGEVPLLKLRQGMRLLQTVRDAEHGTLVTSGTVLTAGQVRQVRKHVHADAVLVQYARRAWIAIPPESRYPVWPLPASGYVLIGNEEELAA